MVGPPRSCTFADRRSDRSATCRGHFYSTEGCLSATGAHVRCEGKGRKERCTPLTKSTVTVLTAWIREQGADDTRILFPSARGGRLSADAVQHLVAKYATAAKHVCPSLVEKR